MSCNKCNPKPKIKTHYSACCEEKVCGCPIILPTDCVVYQGREFTTLDIRTGDKLTEILKIIERALPEPGVEILATNAPPTVMSAPSPAVERGEIIVEHFIGIDVLPLEHIPVNIISVVFEGVELSSTAYYTRGTDLVIDLSAYGLFVENEDKIKVIYTA